MFWSTFHCCDRNTRDKQLYKARFMAPPSKSCNPLFLGYVTFRTVMRWYIKQGFVTRKFSPLDNWEASREKE